VRGKLLKSVIVTANEKYKKLKATVVELSTDPLTVLQTSAAQAIDGEDTVPERNGHTPDQISALRTAYRLDVMANYSEELYRKLLHSRYEVLFQKLKVRPEYTALKCLLRTPTPKQYDDEVGSYIQSHPLTRECEWNLQLSASFPDLVADTIDESDILNIPLSPPVVKGAKKTNFRESYSTAKKLLLWLARHPGAKSLADFEATVRMEQAQVQEMLERLQELELVVRTTDGRLMLTKRGLPR
jgi:hypothetical protein